VGFSSQASLTLSAVTKLVQLVMTWPVSYVGDRFGCTATMLAGGVGCAVMAMPALFLVLASAGGAGAEGFGTEQGPPASAYIVSFVLLAVLFPVVVAFYLVPSTLYLTSMFPADFRGRGAGIGLGLSSLAGGFTPLICSALASRAEWLPGLFVTALAVPSVAALWWSRGAARSGQLRVFQRAWLF